MFRLPLLIRILPARHLKEEAIVDGRLLEISEVIQGRSPQKVSQRRLRQRLDSYIEGFKSQGIILVLTGGKRQITIGLAKIRFEFYRCQKFLLRFGKFLFVKQ